MKGKPLIQCSILLLLLTALVPLQTAAAPGNAAPFYLKAQDLYKKTPFEGDTVHIVNIVSTGWAGAGEAGANHLEQNRPCLEALHKALTMDSCDFNAGQKKRYTSQTGPPLRLSTALRLAELLLLEGLSQQAGKDDETARATFLSMLVFARHFGAFPGILSRGGAVKIEGLACAALNRLLSFSKNPAVETKTLEPMVRAHLEKRFHFRAVVEDEREIYFQLIQALLNDIRKQLTGRENAAELFEMTKQKMEFRARELSEHYYGLMFKAVETGNPGDWENQRRAVNQLGTRVKGRWKTPAERLFQEPFQKPLNLNDATIDGLAGAAMFTFMFNGEPMFKDWKNNTTCLTNLTGRYRESSRTTSPTRTRSKRYEFFQRLQKKEKR